LPYWKDVFQEQGGSDHHGLIRERRMMKMHYVRGGTVWAIPVWDQPVGVEVQKWTESMVEKTEPMRQHKQTIKLQLPRDLKRRLNLADDTVTLTVNGSVSLSSSERVEPLCVF
jgi:hypothetical protein